VVAGAAPADSTAGVRKCGDAKFAAHVRTTRLSCHRGRQIAHYWETHGKCPDHWRFTDAGQAPPNTGVGGSLLRCTKIDTHSYVTWVETEGGDD
jgi:hypothetical protein